MKINPKVTGALAWTGLVVVLAVPAADMLIGKPDAKANLAADVEPVQTAVPKPVETPVVAAGTKPVVPAIESKPAAVETAAVPADPVKEYISSGKKLPSYISGNDSPAVEAVATPQAPVAKPGTITVNPDGTIQKPASTTAAARAAAPAAAPAQPEVASIKPELVAPIPLPASARPKPQVTTATTGPIQTLPAPVEQPLIIDERSVASNRPVPPVDIVPDDEVITGDQLEEWDSGSLADYLARRGLMSDASQAPARRDFDRVGSDYDPDGFFLDEGPNNRNRRSRVIIY